MFEDEVHTLTLSVSPTAILYKRRCMTHLTPSHRASMSVFKYAESHASILSSSETNQNSAQLKQRQ
jgi:hypothetical protein